MKRILHSSCIGRGAIVSGASLVAQSVPEINYDANRRSDLAAVVRRSGGRRDQLARPRLRLRANRPRGRHARRRAHLLSRRLAALSVRSERQVREGNRTRRLRDQLRAAGARRSAGQHLDRRRRLESDREVRSRRPLSDGARTETGEHRRPSRRRRAGECAGRRGGARYAAPEAARRRRWRWRSRRSGIPAPASTATASTVRRT